MMLKRASIRRSASIFFSEILLRDYELLEEIDEISLLKDPAAPL
jgi:hypothetical protein